MVWVEHQVLVRGSVDVTNTTGRALVGEVAAATFGHGASHMSYSSNVHSPHDPSMAAWNGTSSARRPRSGR